MIGSSLLMASFGFMISSITSVNAKSPGSMYANIPVNADGSISVRLSDQQLKALEPNAVLDVNISKINGWDAGAHWSYNSGGTAYYALDIFSSGN